MSKKNLLACSSGGRTSMYQLEWLIENKSDEYNICGIFANTSWEHKKTIEFVNNCAKRWKEKYNFDLVWVEAVVNKGRVACTHKVVTYETCKQNLEVFKGVCEKYGVPSAAYPHCTRELKENPIHHYVKSVLGWSNSESSYERYYTALGIRIDEPSRIIGQKPYSYLKKQGLSSIDSAMSFRDAYISTGNKLGHIEGLRALSKRAEFAGIEGLEFKNGNKDLAELGLFWSGESTSQKKVYPLVDWHPEQPDKADILDWWSEQEFDLGIPEHLGNCVGCFRKSTKKTLKVIRDAPEQFANTLERDYGHIGHNKIGGKRVDQPRTMYRQYMTHDKLIALYKDTDPEYLKGDEYEESNEGCASSCEPFAS